MARTRAVYHRDKRGAEPVNAFIEALPAKRAAKIDDYVEEHLNGRPPQAPPPEFPLSSQIDGELRELRVRFGNTRYRVLYQRSGNLVVFSSQEKRALHYLEVDPWTTELVARGSYVCASDPARLQTRVRVAVMPPRVGTTVYGLAFASNRVLHSGLDGEHGHFIAAYGVEIADRGEG